MFSLFVFSFGVCLGSLFSVVSAGTLRAFYALKLKRVENSGDGLQAAALPRGRFPQLRNRVSNDSSRLRSPHAVYYIYLGIAYCSNFRCVTLECVRGNPLEG